MSGINESGEPDNVGMDDAVNAAIKKMTDDMKTTGSSVKGSVTDLIRLLQLRKELEGERPRKVTVRWIGEECDNSTEE